MLLQASGPNLVRHRDVWLICFRSTRFQSNHRLLAFTAKGLASAAAAASKLKSVVRYNPKNLTIWSAKPEPSAAPLPAGLDGVPAPPSVYPFDEKVALDFAGPLAAALEAFETAVRIAEGFAPLIVSVTLPFVKTRKVGILFCTHKLNIFSTATVCNYVRADAILLCYVLVGIHVDLRKGQLARLAMRGRELFENGRNC